MRTPPHVIAFRLITVTITTAILVALAFGLAGRGPLGGLRTQVTTTTTQSTGAAG